MPNLGRVDPRSLPQLFAWYNANYVNGIGQAQPAADTAISQWNDLSGNGRHLAQGTGANQPLFRLTGGPDNRPSVNFVDNTDTMTLANAAVTARPVTLVGVFKNTLADDAAYHRAITFNTTRISIGLDWTGAQNVFTAFDDAAVFVGGSVAGDVTLYHVASFVAQPVGPLSRSGVDGVHATAAGIAGTNTNSDIQLGVAGANGWIGHICEAIIFTGEIAPSVMFALEQSLAEAWTLFTSYRIAA